MCLVSTSVAQPRYDEVHMQREHLGRGLAVVADNSDDSLVLSWRFLKEDSLQTRFNVYANNKRLNPRAIINSTFMKTSRAVLSEDSTVFEVRTLDNGVEKHRCDGRFTVVGNHPVPYLSIPLNKPYGGQTLDGRRYGYTANDASVGDVDGDGEYEIILKWEPTNAHDNSQEGYTGNVLVDAYRLTGEQLWRIDLGCNIRAGAHYTQMMVYDLDGDGRAEVVMKTADGTRDGVGNCIGDSLADWRMDMEQPRHIAGKSTQRVSRVMGRILDGPEYLTVFDGLSGRALYTTDYVPARGNVADWGDNYGNRCDRFLACIAYLDGLRPSVVMCRGYYTRTVLAAWNWDGRELTQRWVFDTNQPQWHAYAGQGNHNLRVADVDGDGKDEIIYGAMCVDHDGQGLYTTGMGHGDALHLMPFYSDSTSLQVWDVHENRRDGSELHDARTGRVIFQLPSHMDVGRGMAADIDPQSDGVEMWSSDSHGIRNVKGEVVAADVRIPVNAAIWWDGDLQRELLDHVQISKYDWKEKRCDVIADFSGECAFNNGSKSNPCLSADIVGDWREELIVRTRDNSELRIYVTTIPTQFRIPCLMQDIPYRLGVATENVGYNQPPEMGQSIERHHGLSENH